VKVNKKLIRKIPELKQKQQKKLLKEEIQKLQHQNKTFKKELEQFQNKKDSPEPKKKKKEIVICPECEEGEILETIVPFGKMFLCSKCTYRRVER
jgi:formylmethanofuran dehydrogenase subunit E